MANTGWGLQAWGSSRYGGFVGVIWSKLSKAVNSWIKSDKSTNTWTKI